MHSSQGHKPKRGVHPPLVRNKLNADAMGRRPESPSCGRGVRMEWSLSRVIAGSLTLGRPPGCIGSLSVYLRPTLEFEQDGKREAVARGGGLTMKPLGGILGLVREVVCGRISRLLREHPLPPRDEGRMKGWKDPGMPRIMCGHSSISPLSEVSYYAKAIRPMPFFTPKVPIFTTLCHCTMPMRICENNLSMHQ